MKSIRKSVFETNSSSTHSLTLVQKSSKNMYTLSENGYLEAGFDDYFSECSYDVYSTVEEKLRFLLTLLASFYYEYKRNEHFKQTGKWLYGQYTTQKELKSMEEFKEIQKLVKKNIPNCKGLRFRKNSFNENGEVAGGIDTHHHHECHNLNSYLKKNGITLEQFLFSPHIVIQMNV